MVGGVVCPANVSAVEWYENLRSHDILRRKVTFMFGGVERAASGRHQGAATQNDSYGHAKHTMFHSGQVFQFLR